MAKDKPSQYFLTTLEKGLKILSLFTVEQPNLSRVEISRLTGIDSQEITAVAGGAAGGTGVNVIPAARGTIEIPTIDVTQVNTGVTIPDKGTVLLGGQRLTNEVEIETGVPVLSKLPIINRFFTNRAEIRDERTLLILMKPTIIIQSEREEEEFPGLLDQLRNPFR